MDYDGSVLDYLQPGLLHDAIKGDAELLKYLDEVVVPNWGSSVQVAINICYLPFSGRTVKGYRKKLRATFWGGPWNA